MQREFEMSMMGELNFFLGLQVKQVKHGKLLKKFNMVSILKLFSGFIFNNFRCALIVYWTV